jgi:type II secretory pathway component PulF
MKDDPAFRELPDSFDERVPAPAAPPPPVRRWDLALMTLGYFAVTAAGLMVIVPKFETVFLQVKIPMPGLTLMVMSLSGFCRAHPLLFAALMTGIPASIHVWQPRAVSIGRVAIPLLFWVMWGWMVVGLFLPLIGTLEGIGPRR